RDFCDTYGCVECDCLWSAGPSIVEQLPGRQALSRAVAPARNVGPVGGRTAQARYLCRGFFFFQAEDGIRDWSVTGVQTCALPIWLWVLGIVQQGVANLLREWEPCVPPSLAGNAQCAIVPVDIAPL